MQVNNNGNAYKYTEVQRKNHAKVYFSWVLDSRFKGHFGFHLVPTIPTLLEARAALINAWIIQQPQHPVASAPASARDACFQFNMSKYPHCTTFNWNQINETCATYLWKIAINLSSPSAKALSAIHKAYSFVLPETDGIATIYAFTNSISKRHCITLEGAVATVIARFAYGSSANVETMISLADHGGEVKGNLRQAMTAKEKVMTADIYWNFTVPMAYFFQTVLSKYETVTAQGILTLKLYEFEQYEKQRLNHHGFWSSKGIRQLLENDKQGLTQPVQQVLLGPTVMVMSALALILPGYVDLHEHCEENATVLFHRDNETSGIGVTFAGTACLSIAGQGDIGRFGETLTVERIEVGDDPVPQPNSIWTAVDDDAGTHWNRIEDYSSSEEEDSDANEESEQGSGSNSGSSSGSGSN